MPLSYPPERQNGPFGSAARPFRANKARRRAAFSPPAPGAATSAPRAEDQRLRGILRLYERLSIGYIGASTVIRGVARACPHRDLLRLDEDVELRAPTTRGGAPRTPCSARDRDHSRPRKARRPGASADADTRSRRHARSRSRTPRNATSASRASTSTSPCSTSRAKSQRRPCPQKVKCDGERVQAPAGSPGGEGARRLALLRPLQPEGSGG